MCAQLIGSIATNIFKENIHLLLAAHLSTGFNDLSLNF